MSRTTPTIKRLGAPVLWKVAEPLPERAFGMVKRSMPSLLDLLRRADGLAVAAPQLGFSRRYWVDNLQGGRLVINPQIIEVSRQKVSLLEGCLSIPGMEVEIERPAEIHMRYEALDGTLVSVEAKLLEARLIQHEMDHLDGLTIFDHMSEDQIQEFQRFYSARPR